MEDIIKALPGLGAAGPVVGFLIYLYWQERSERRDMTSKIFDILSDAISAEKAMTAALNILSSRLK